MHRLTQQLDRLKSGFRHRSLRLPHGVDFTSNDYLGLARHPALRQAIVGALAEDDATVGSTASRLLRGHHPAHEALEAFAAGFFGCARALYFANGFLANYALFTTLPHRHDAVVYDEYVHASVRDGIQACHARPYRVPHNDLDAFADTVRRARQDGAHGVWIAVESVYSMDGDVAPVAALHALAHEEDAFLIVDEAHATGIFGATGRGVAEGLYDDRLIVLHTCGKALGAAGGLLCGPAITVDYLINCARPFIYSTAPPPHLAAAVQRALALIDEEPWRRTVLLQRTSFARDRLTEAAGDAVAASGTQIIPVVLGSDRRTVETAAALQARGLDVRAIRPPTVPEGTSRLRISLSAERSEAEITTLAQVLHDALQLATAE